MPIENISELNTTVQRLIQRASGVTAIILADQDGSPPTGLYGTYKITPIRAYGRPKVIQSDIAPLEPVPTSAWQDFSETLITSMEMMVSINFFNDGAANAAMKLQQSQFRFPVADYCRENEIAWRTTSETRNLSNIDQALMQDRYQLDLDLWAGVQITDDIMAAASYSITVEDENGNILFNQGGQ